MTAEAEAEPNVLNLAFSIKKESAAASNKMMFTDDMSTFEIVKHVMNNHGYSLNDFKAIKDEAGNEVTFADKLVDGKAYEIIVCDTYNCGEEEEDY